MRKLILFWLPVILVTMAFTTDHSLPEKVTRQIADNEFNLDDWEIDKQTADRMIDYVTSCKGKCRHSLKLVRNLKVKQELEKLYHIDNYTSHKARYTADDMPRYRKARKLADNDGKGKVEGFTTMIGRYELSPKQGRLMGQVRVFFADEYSICPPPDSPPCN